MMKKIIIFIVSWAIVFPCVYSPADAQTDQEKTIVLIEKMHEARNQQFMYMVNAYVHENERAGVAIEVVVMLLEAEAKNKKIDIVKLNMLMDRLEDMTNMAILINKDMDKFHIWETWDYLIKRDSH